jgi:CelD/BcsL family acetyltransferase involved in cellulose biosynthesis
MPEIEVIDNVQDFATLDKEWEDLYRNSPLATPFQSWAWLYSWWEYYGEGYRLCLVLVRDEGLLVGLIPLMLERRGGFGRLLFVGTGLTDYQDILARRGWKAQVSEAGRRALEQMEGWHVADLQQLRPEAVAWDIFRKWAGPRTYVWQDNCPVLDVKPWDELLASLNSKLRNTVRRTLRRAEADRVRCEIANVEDAEQAAQRLVALHREAWRGRDIVPEHLTRRFESHVRAAVRRMAARQLGAVSEFWRDGEVIVSHFLVFSQDFVAEYMIGVKQEVLRRYQFSTLALWDTVNVARNRNSSRLSWGRGDEPYKLRWASELMPNNRVILGRSLPSWSLYVNYQMLYARASRYASSEGAPRLVKGTADIYRALRNTYRALR